jgi:hypothetical protein
MKKIKKKFLEIQRKVRNSKEINEVVKTSPMVVETINREMKPFKVKGVTDARVKILKNQMLKLKVGKSFPTERKFRYAIYKIGKTFYPEYTFKIIEIGEKCSVLRSN